MINILLAFTVPLYSLAVTLELKDILDYSLENYPGLLKQVEETAISKAKVNEVDGNFDMSLDAKINTFTEGFYDTDFSRVSLTKPIKVLNSKLEVGARKSNGNLPVYYQEYETGENPEYFIKLKMSLLKFRSIDPKRYKLFEAKNKLFIQNQKLISKRLDLELNINNLYLKWLFLYQKQKIYKSLIKLNTKRINAIKRRVKKNDLAQIYVVESQQYLLNFQNVLIDTNMKISQVANKLRVYYPILKEEHRPIKKLEFNSTSDFSKYDTKIIVNKRPEIKVLKKMFQLTKKELKLSNQFLIPKLDLSASHYSSESKKEKFQNESFISLNLSIPIERSLGRGKKQIAKAKSLKIKAIQEEVKRKLSLEINNLKAEISGNLLSLQNLKKEISISKRLQDAEWKRFNSGASDFFLTNTRDTNYAKAKLNFLEKLINFKQAKFNLDLWKKQI